MGSNENFKIYFRDLLTFSSMISLVEQSNVQPTECKFIPQLAFSTVKLCSKSEVMLLYKNQKFYEFLFIISNLELDIVSKLIHTILKVLSFTLPPEGLCLKKVIIISSFMAYEIPIIL